jgi:outer membrane autotransporter protein
MACVTAAPAHAQSRTGQIVFVIDESGSMSGEQTFLQGFVPALEQQLLSAGLSGVQFGLVGYGNSAVVPRQFLIGGQPFGTAADWATAANGLQVSGGTEDGYAGIQYVLDNYNFAGGANTAVVVLVTDEDRDDTNNALTFNVILVNLQNANVSLSAILNQAIQGPGGETGLATDGVITYIDANNDGVPEEVGAPTFGSAAGATDADYTQLVLSFSNGCVADLNQLRSGGTAAQAFAETLARCLIQQALGGTGRDHFLSAPSVATRGAMLTHTDALLFRLSGRFGGFDGGASATGLGEAPATFINASRTRRGFAIASYGNGAIDAMTGQPGFKFEGSHLMMGFDADVTERVLAGFSLAFSRGYSDARGRADRWRHEVLSVAAYTSLTLDHGVQLDGVASFGMAEYETRRAVSSISGADFATASPNGEVYALRARASRSYALMDNRLELTPHVGASYTHVKVDDYQESGPGAVGVANYAHDVTTIDLGVEAQTSHQTRWGDIRPSLQLGAEYAVDSDDETVRVTTALGGGFDQIVPAYDEWTGVVGLGATLSGEDQRYAVRVGYEGRFSEDMESHAVSVRGRIRF